MKKITKNVGPKRGRGFTLVELLTALSITGVVSVAACALISGAMNTDCFLRNQGTAVSEVEYALHRLENNVRVSTAAPSWDGVNHVLSLTVPGATGAVTYTFANSKLVEYDSRYGSNPVATNVTAFTAVVSTSPATVTMTLKEGLTGTSGTAVQRPISRVVTVYCRNL